MNAASHGFLTAKSSCFSSLPSNAVALSSLIVIAAGSPAIDIAPLVFSVRRACHVPCQSFGASAGIQRAISSGKSLSTPLAAPPPASSFFLQPTSAAAATAMVPICLSIIAGRISKRCASASTRSCEARAAGSGTPASARQLQRVERGHAEQERDDLAARDDRHVLELRPDVEQLRVALAAREGGE